ncbi:hypothetical protein R3P38DRAFT_3175865 [Favolaschia claudopus]|uniref:Uncharacterized protein n=1 Tax=Favolaschia claudopus TaxID=2862362 RepID=A0AAW0D6R2_9AGAR
MTSTPRPLSLGCLHPADALPHSPVPHALTTPPRSPPRHVIYDVSDTFDDVRPPPPHLLYSRPSLRCHVTRTPRRRLTFKSRLHRILRLRRLPNATPQAHTDPLASRLQPHANHFLQDDPRPPSCPPTPPSSSFSRLSAPAPHPNPTTPHPDSADFAEFRRRPTSPFLLTPRLTLLNSPSPPLRTRADLRSLRTLTASISPKPADAASKSRIASAPSPHRHLILLTPRSTRYRLDTSLRTHTRVQPEFRHPASHPNGVNFAELARAASKMIRRRRVFHVRAQLRGVRGFQKEVNQVIQVCMLGI